MKKFIGYYLSWICYWLGDFVSMPMNNFDWAWLYPVYNRLMLWSGNLQYWADIDGPWRDGIE